MATKKNPYEFYTPIDYTQTYDAMAQARRDALDAAYNQQVNELNAQLPEIKNTYDAQRNQTYRNARATALGNNEGLAARGLAGNAYTAPVTGYSETSRIAETNALRNALNALNLQQQGQENTIGKEIRQAGYSRDAALAEALANIEQNRIAAQQAENQFGANYNLNVWRAQQEQEQAAAEMAYEKAMNELQMFGRVMTKASANALGIPVGTTLAQYRGGSGGGGSRRTGGASRTSSGTTGGFDVDAILAGLSGSTQQSTPTANTGNFSFNSIASAISKAAQDELNKKVKAGAKPR